MEKMKMPWTAVRRRFRPGDEIFTDGDVLCRVLQKQILCDAEKEQQDGEMQQRLTSFVCHVMNCSRDFDSVSRYEAHYNSTHRNLCSVCHRSLPSSRLLELHLVEWHDSMFQILASKSSMYECLVAECSLRFQTPELRQNHLVTQHKYPANFRFNKVGKKSKNRNKNKSAKSEVNEKMAMDVSVPCDLNKSHDNHAESCVHLAPDAGQTKPQTTRRQFSYRVPDRICFGQGVPRGFNRQHRGGHKKKGGKKHWHQNQTPGGTTSVNIEEVQMTDLAEALQ